MSELLRDLADCLEDMTKHYVEVRNDLYGFEAGEEIEVVAAGKLIAEARRLPPNDVAEPVASRRWDKTYPGGQWLYFPPDHDGEKLVTLAQLAAVTAENARLREALEKIDAIRNSIIGFQTVGWSDHIYPMVAALEEAGFEGKGYDKMRTEIRTMLAAEARATTAEAQLTAAREALYKMVDLYESEYDAGGPCIRPDWLVAAISQEAPK